MESARKIRHLPRGSPLARSLDRQDDPRQFPGLLYQDLYALCTAAQWIGPQLEDFLLAHEQVTTELNSITDNPLVDFADQKTDHGNFQATSIPPAMEKTRLSLRLLGKILFAQCSELINPMLNNGTPSSSRPACLSEDVFPSARASPLYGEPQDLQSPLVQD